MEANERIKFIQSKIDDAAAHNGFCSAHGEELRWLIEQAERAEIYKHALMEIGSNKFSSPESQIANEALIKADCR